MADHWLLYYNGGTDFSLVAHGIALPEQFLRFGFLFRGGFAAWVDIFGTALPYGDIVPCMTDETVGFALRGKLRRFAIVTSWLYLSTNTTEKI